MFGYIQINQKELKIREYDTYRSYYCGLCHVLSQKFGIGRQVLLGYDMTFLAILLNALYEPEVRKKKRRCLPHPAVSHLQAVSQATDYAADMTLLLAYQKALDDWRDEKNRAKRVLALTLHKEYARLRRVYPRQAKTLEKCIRELSEAEKAGITDPDYVAGLTGTFLGEIFVWKDDLWETDLRRMGFYLGKFIYLMDAYDDLKKDQKRGQYNLLIPMKEKDPDQFEAQIMAILTDTMSRCCQAFERLPIIQDAGILRNILYGGVWVRYAAKHREAAQDDTEAEKAGEESGQ